MRITDLCDTKLKTRGDVQEVLLALLRPVLQRLSTGAARARLGATGAHFTVRESELEGFSRPLWGIASFLAGGGDGISTDYIRTGLVNGTNPDHPEYWGRAHNCAHQFVEMAPIAFALQVLHADLLTPLPAVTRAAVGRWLDQINQWRVYDNNWLLFRVLVNAALPYVTGIDRSERIRADLRRVDALYVGDGWYTDGPGGRFDSYTAFTFHFYSLIYARLASTTGDTEWAHRARSRAAAFAMQWLHWFDHEGRAIPFGRSLTYRAALGAFWGALAFANVEALPWDIIKGLALRHIRWWLAQPILDSGGLLTIGYAYPNLNVAERYNGPASPYWMLKCFLPLALPDEHPFWQASEAELPNSPSTHVQALAGIVVCTDEYHTFVLNAGQPAQQLRHGDAKYGKFAYSSRFGFSVPAGSAGRQQGAFDSMLALSEDGRYYRTRTACVAARVDAALVYSLWIPWPMVEIDTWLLAHPPWHVRVHRLRTDRELTSAEGGFSVPRDDDHELQTAEGGTALAWSPSGWCGIRSLGSEQREGLVDAPEPNTNVMHPRTLLPTLLGRHAPGDHWLACAVAAGGDAHEQAWSTPPRLSLSMQDLIPLATVHFADGTRTFRLRRHAPQQQGEHTCDE